jgi:hypothetical protein
MDDVLVTAMAEKPKPWKQFPQDENGILNGPRRIDEQNRKPRTEGRMAETSNRLNSPFHPSIGNPAPRKPMMAMSMIRWSRGWLFAAISGPFGNRLEGRRKRRW